MAKENTININGVSYALIPDMEGEGSECERCALQEKCNDESGCICQTLFGEDVAKNHRFELAKEYVTEQQAYDAYQERSVTAGDRANQMAWAFIIVLCAQLIGSDHFKEPYVIAAGGISYLWLSAMQSLWQAVTMWLFKQQIRRNGLQLEDYPDWIGGGAWVFYILKMLVITVTAIYAIWKFIQLI